MIPDTFKTWFLLIAAGATIWQVLDVIDLWKKDREKAKEETISLVGWMVFPVLVWAVWLWLKG